jgi:antitoxin ParD1/3/4
MAGIRVSLPDEMREWIDAQVESGEYADTSDYIRDLVRYDRREREAIRLALIEGEQSGISPLKVGDIVAAAKRGRKAPR